MTELEELEEVFSYPPSHLPYPEELVRFTPLLGAPRDF